MPPTDDAAYDFEDRLYLIANPVAAGGVVGEEFDDIASTFRSILGPFAHGLTERRGHATELAREAIRQGYTIIGSLGGDGTHNEVVNGFFDEDGAVINGEAALAVFPMGTGGDFRKTLGLNGELVQALLRVARNSPSRCDVGRLTFIDNDGNEATRHFINIASFGIGGLVDVKVNESSKALGGTMSFMIGTVRALAEYQPHKVKLTVDDRTAEVVINAVAVANGRYFGGGMKIAPRAEIDDGLFDVVILRPTEFGELLRDAIKLYDGRHFESPAVSLLKGRHVEAVPTSDEAHVLLDVDGEAPGRLPATFDVIPSAIGIIR